MLVFGWRKSGREKVEYRRYIKTLSTEVMDQTRSGWIYFRLIFEVAINVARKGGLNCDPFKNYS